MMLACLDGIASMSPPSPIFFLVRDMHYVWQLPYFNVSVVTMAMYYLSLPVRRCVLFQALDHCSSNSRKPFGDGAEEQADGVQITISLLKVYGRMGSSDCWSGCSGLWWMVNGLHLYSAFLTSGHSKHFTILPHIHPFKHTFTHQRRRQPCKATASSSWAVRVRCLAQDLTPRHSARRSRGIKPATLRLPANRLYCRATAAP